MKQLKVPLINVDPALTNILDISVMLGQQERHAIEIAPWPAASPNPDVSFSIAHTGDYLMLKYFVTESYLRAAHFEYNAPVYEDSCVECFMAFGEDVNYYNLEMNSTGCLRMGYGEGRENRQLLGEDVLRKISRTSAITRNRDSDKVYWEITAIMPLNIFTRAPVAGISGSSCRANFYKCGDHLPEPHFLCWSAITADQPDFHRPGFFGALHFE